jgi:hypothetical protein
LEKNVAKLQSYFVENLFNVRKLFFVHKTIQIEVVLVGDNMLSVVAHFKPFLYPLGGLEDTFSATLAARNFPINFKKDELNKPGTKKNDTVFYRA